MKKIVLIFVFAASFLSANFDVCVKDAQSRDLSKIYGFERAYFVCSAESLLMIMDYKNNDDADLTTTGNGHPATRGKLDVMRRNLVSLNQSCKCDKSGKLILQKEEL